MLQRLQDIAVRTRLVERRLGAELGVNGTDLHAMEHLSTDGALTARELADRLQVSTAAGTQIVDRLERAGHASRRPHATDRRKILVTPSAASVAAATEFLRPLLDELEAAVGALGDQERGAVESFLDTVVAIYDRHTTSAPEGVT
ncbi:MarR family transcriptional regulator [Pseudonocardia ailaonensis]|uniref:MarR family transcriptional regulator n=1 Tax=Pseudonocardia ailaonensis TaxID=367279 RepID=A0ABN2N6V0_9PSEU